MKQVKMLKDAMKNNYIVPAFNIANFEILRGLLVAAKEMKSPIILQIMPAAPSMAAPFINVRVCLLSIMKRS